MKLSEFLFDRPTEGLEWYFGDDIDFSTFDPIEVVDGAAKIFLNVESLLGVYSESQLCLGFNCLINPSCSDFCYSFLDRSIAEVARVAAISNMFNVFDKVFNRTCCDLVRQRGAASGLDYGYICHMWWDIFPRHGIPYDSGMTAIDTTILEILERLLLLDGIACKESGLHGLGHWHVAYPERVEEIIDRNLSSIPMPLSEYAALARQGDVQ